MSAANKTLVRTQITMRFVITAQLGRCDLRLNRSLLNFILAFLGNMNENINN